ncbi:hypothetical protein EVAR_8909_1 [Eumeta japonica]|uniref:Uncharacterized protein n=1 Tax=Eumeta variegata TaxID=151549 RepID=A0A4C1U0D3_EUMVA|nr:hypothetical protein EVAR_8909_1 [Eumeta japonica]
MVATRSRNKRSGLYTPPQYNARNFAAVKFVTKASQWRKIGTRRRRNKGRGAYGETLAHGQPLSPGRSLPGALTQSGLPIACGRPRVNRRADGGEASVTLVYKYT